MAKKLDTAAAVENHIRILTPDPKNARKHNPRNVGEIVKSIEHTGMGRSIVIDEAGKIIAGNATIEAASEVGITKLRIIETDGKEVIAIRRTGLTEAQKTELALRDNRSAELAGWEPQVIQELSMEMPELMGDMFTTSELEMITGEVPSFDEAPIEEQGKLDELKSVTCPKCGEVFTPDAA